MARLGLVTLGADWQGMAGKDRSGVAKCDDAGPVVAWQARSGSAQFGKVRFGAAWQAGSGMARFSRSW